MANCAILNVNANELSSDKEYLGTFYWGKTRKYDQLSGFMLHVVEDYVVRIQLSQYECT